MNPTISSLLSNAAQYLRAQFEYVRQTNPHSAEKGAEVEEVVKAFLNDYLPKRFHATSGLIIDNDNNLSKQTDVIIYDAMSSPVFRASERTNIIPVDGVATVMEVKSNLTRETLTDACDKLAVIKRLNKNKVMVLDQQVRPGPIVTATMAIIFGFRSELKLLTIADHLRAYLDSTDPSHWPDGVVLLDGGVITFGRSYPGQVAGRGTFHLPHGQPKRGLPDYVHLLAHLDRQFTLHRLLTMLNTHLTFYPMRPSYPPLHSALADASKEVQTITAYQYDTGGMLRAVPDTEYDALAGSLLTLNISLKKKRDIVIAKLQRIPWQDGAVVRGLGAPRLDLLLQKLLPNVTQHWYRDWSGAYLSNVLALTEEEFKGWARKIAAHGPYVATLTTEADPAGTGVKPIKPENADSDASNATGSGSRSI